MEVLGGELQQGSMETCGHTDQIPKESECSRKCDMKDATKLTKVCLFKNELLAPTV